MVRTSDVADKDIQEAYLWYLQRSPELAHRWMVGLLDKLESLSTMPGRCPIASENERFEEVTIRQHLYGKYRILFFVIEPYNGDQGVVQVIRVIHSARNTI